MAKQSGGNTAQRVEALVRPVVEGMGLRLWDVVFEKEGPDWYLRVLIDRDGTMDTDTCAEVSHALDPILDEADPIDQSYYLEVGSPGLGRKLTRPEHYEALKGEKIGVKLCISGCVGALALILTGVISEKDALKSIDLKTIFLFGGTLSLASALSQTGAGAMIAETVMGALGENPSPYVLTFVVFILCCVMTNFMSNTATTALMVPICLSIAQGMGADPRAVLMACVIGGSCAYATPIGMPANTMAVGAGGYTFMDYVKSGLPLIVIATIVSMIILPIAFPFFP